MPYVMFEKSVITSLADKVRALNSSSTETLLSSDMETIIDETSQDIDSALELSEQILAELG